MGYFSAHPRGPRAGSRDKSLPPKKPPRQGPLPRIRGRVSAVASPPRAANSPPYRSPDRAHRAPVCESVPVPFSANAKKRKAEVPRPSASPSQASRKKCWPGVDKSAIRFALAPLDPLDPGRDHAEFSPLHVARPPTPGARR